MNWIIWASVPVFICGLWIYTAQLTQTFPMLRNKRICLLIAHPDDEAMFFAPTVLALTRPELENHVKILCMSTGNADGLGEVRRKELVKSGVQLGLRNEDDVLVLNDPNFPDSMTIDWDPRLLSNTLTSAFAPNMSKIPSNKAPQATIDVLITFDPQGISGHTNHRSLYYGAHAFLKALMQRHSGWECPIKLYTLTSTNIARKYMGVLDLPLSLINSVLRRKERGGFPTPLLFVSNPTQYRIAQKAMTTAHKSQMIWFRWGWISIGRYMFMNDLKKEKTAK